MRHHFGVSLCVRFQFHTTWLTWLLSQPLLSFALLSFTAQASILYSSTSPTLQGRVPWHDMLQSRDMTFYGHRLSFPWMDGWMWWPTFHIRTMGAPRLTSSLNMLQEIGGWGSLRFPFRNNIYHNPGEYSKLWEVIHFMVAWVGIVSKWVWTGIDSKRVHNPCPSILFETYTWTCMSCQYIEFNNSCLLYVLSL